MQPTQFSKRQQDQLNELNKLMSSEIDKVMSESKFSTENIPASFQNWIYCALPHETALTMNANYADFKKFWTALNTKKVGEYTLWEMGFAINMIQSKSMVQLHCSTTEKYLEIQDAVTAMGAQWSKEAEELRKPIHDRYQKLADRVRDHKPIIMPDKTLIH